MHDSHKLKIDIQSYWHAGTGRGRSFEIDSVVHCDRDGLPALPGRSVKGLVRDAVTAAVALGWIQTASAIDAHVEVVDRLFGPLGVDGATTYPGWLQVSDATLADDIREAVRGEAKLRAAMFTNLFTTAVDHDRGSALDKSLRGTEVAVPMTLYATLSINPHANQYAADLNPPTANLALEWIKTSLPLLRSLGSHRNRGLGRATFSLLKDAR